MGTACDPIARPSCQLPGIAWAAEPRKPRFLSKDKADGVHLFPPKTAKRVSLFFMDVWFCTASGCLTTLSSLDLCKVLFPQ